MANPSREICWYVAPVPIGFLGNLKIYRSYCHHGVIGARASP